MISFALWLQIFFYWEFIGMAHFFLITTPISGKQRAAVVEPVLRPGPNRARGISPLLCD